MYMLINNIGISLKALSRPVHKYTLFAPVNVVWKIRASSSLSYLLALPVLKEVSLWSAHVITQQALTQFSLCDLPRPLPLLEKTMTKGEAKQIRVALEIRLIVLKYFRISVRKARQIISMRFQVHIQITHTHMHIYCGCVCVCGDDILNCPKYLNGSPLMKCDTYFPCPTEMQSSPKPKIDNERKRKSERDPALSLARAHRQSSVSVINMRLIKSTINKCSVSAWPTIKCERRRSSSNSTKTQDRTKSSSDRDREREGDWPGRSCCSSSWWCNMSKYVYESSRECRPAVWQGLPSRSPQSLPNHLRQTGDKFS